jgi:nitrite reductase/ring-hydroxylating ferredoxin subunit
VTPVKVVGSFWSNDHTVTVLQVGRDAHVWWDGIVARCCQCNGPLTAMSASCSHARAAKRRAPQLVPAKASPASIAETR